jgi:hypothetical protein
MEQGQHQGVGCVRSRCQRRVPVVSAEHRELSFRGAVALAEVTLRLSWLSRQAQVELLMSNDLGHL